MPKAKAKATSHASPAKKRAAFKDPIMDGMRQVGKALQNQKQDDIKFILSWARGKFLDGDNDE